MGLKSVISHFYNLFAQLRLSKVNLKQGDTALNWFVCCLSVTLVERIRLIGSSWNLALLLFFTKEFIKTVRKSNYIPEGGQTVTLPKKIRIHNKMAMGSKKTITPDQEVAPALQRQSREGVERDSWSCLEMAVGPTGQTQSRARAEWGFPDLFR